MESFADLLQRARIRHRTKISTDRLLLLLLMMLMLLLMMMLLLMLLMMIISILKMFVSLLRERRRRRRIKLRHGNGSAPNLVAGFLSHLPCSTLLAFLLEFSNSSVSLTFTPSIFCTYCTYPILSSVLIPGKEKQKLELASSLYKRSDLLSF